MMPALSARSRAPSHIPEGELQQSAVLTLVINSHLQVGLSPSADKEAQTIGL
jgi:hypothetical protein